MSHTLCRGYLAMLAVDIRVTCEGPGSLGSLKHTSTHGCVDLRIYGSLCSVSACTIRCVRRRVALVVDLRVAREGPGSSGSIYHYVNYTYRQSSVEIDLQAPREIHIPATVGRDRPSNFQDLIEPSLRLPVAWGPAETKSLTDIYIYNNNNNNNNKF